MVNDVKLLEFVHDIATDHPTFEIYDETNGCKFCHNTWTENDYDEYLAREEAGPEEFMGRKMSYISEHHESDCLWVRANQLLREMKNTNPNIV